MIAIAINGFGRIGKTFLRTLLADPACFDLLKVAVINVGKADPQAAAYALKYDTLMGTLPFNVEYRDKKLYIDKYAIDVIAELDPAQAPWRDYAIDWVVESSGYFTKRHEAQKHILAGAKSVLITAPAHDEDITIIPGVNSTAFDKTQHRIVSLGSCTTNALVTMLKVVDDAFGIEQACMTTVHAYTNTQALIDVDAPIKDPRRGRSAPLNIVPTTTGAMEVIGRIMPKLKGNITGCSLRVPVAKVSIIDLTFMTRQKLSKQEINAAFFTAADTNLQGIIAITLEPLVSSDYSGNSHSAVIDGLLTETQNNVNKLFGWYDNEWGYSMRLKDFLLHTSKV